MPPTQFKTNPPISNFTGLSAATSGNGLGMSAPAAATSPRRATCATARSGQCPAVDLSVRRWPADRGPAEADVRAVLPRRQRGRDLPGRQRQGGPHRHVSRAVRDSEHVPGHVNPAVQHDRRHRPPAKPNEHPDVTTARGWSKFFGTRYAAYNRHVRIYVQFGSLDSSGGTSAGTQAQDAALAYAKIKPFAIINFSGFGNGTFYNNYMAQHSVMIFGAITARTAATFNEFPGLQWGYGPPLEYSAAQYANGVCYTVDDKPASGIGTNSTAITNNAAQVRPVLHDRPSLREPQGRRQAGARPDAEAVRPRGHDRADVRHQQLQRGQRHDPAVGDQRRAGLPAKGGHHDPVAVRLRSEAQRGAQEPELPARDHRR